MIELDINTIKEWKADVERSLKNVIILKLNLKIISITMPAKTVEFYT